MHPVPALGTRVFELRKSLALANSLVALLYTRVGVCSPHHIECGGVCNEIGSVEGRGGEGDTGLHHSGNGQRVMQKRQESGQGIVTLNPDVL